MADWLVRIREASGPDALGFLASAKCSNEENYLVQKLARQGFGTHNVDHCARLCHAPTVAALGWALGSGAMTNSMDDIVAHARSALVIGSNTTEQHSVLGMRLIKWIGNFLAKLGPFFLFLVGGWLIIERSGSFDVGSLVAALAAYERLNEPWQELHDYYQQKEIAKVRYEQIVATCEAPSSSGRSP